MGTGWGRWGPLGLVLGLLACDAAPPPPAAVPPGDSAPLDDPPPTLPGDGGVTGEPDGGPARGELPPVQRELPVLELHIAPAELAKLDADPYSEERVPARLVLGGQSATAQVRYRGASTRTLPQKSFKVELDPGLKLDGRDHFELLAQYLDAGKLTEVLAVHLFTALGAPVPRVRYVQLRLNGVLHGLYVDMEHVGGEYLRDHGLEKGASIYRCGGRNCELTLSSGSYQGDFEKKSNETWPSDDLDALLRFVNRTDDADFEAGLPARLDVDGYLRNLAGDALISNNLVEDARGYWVHEHGRDRWSYVPWDLNNALMFRYRFDWEGVPIFAARDAELFSVYDPGVEDLYLHRLQQNPAQRPTWSVLNTRLWDRPALREQLLTELEWALEGPFTEARLDPHIDALWALVEPALREDPFVDQAAAQHAPALLKEYVRERSAFLRQEIARLRTHGSGPLVINEVAVGTSVGPGYVELHARGDVDVSLEGLVLTDDLREPLGYRLPAGLVVPAGGFLRLWASGNPALGPEHLPFTLGEEGGELGLFDGQHVYRPLDVLYFGPRAPGSAYGRLPDGSEQVRALAAPTPGLSNR